MLFSSALFLTRFLPVILLVYFIADKKYRNGILIAASIFFYSWKAPLFVFMILGTTVLDFFLVNKIFEATEKSSKKRFLVLSLIINIGLLVYFKYSGFFIENVNEILKVFGGNAIAWTKLALPIGISFYTFESMTYVIDVYRGVHEPQKKFSNYLLYIIFFPKLIAGPIVRYHEIADQLENREETNDNRLAGFVRFCTGLAKKILIANYLGQFATTILGSFDQKIPGLDPSTLHASTAWLGAFSFTFQIYFDFSGYSDMAIGLGKMFGFHLPENFNQPYLADSITDFWRRWHITLGAWMKNYLYIPLGGNRTSSIKIYRNIFIVFLLSGLWHGDSWNFVIWGCWHGFFLVTERLFLLKFYEKIFRPIRIAITFFFVVIGWIIFDVKNVRNAFGYIGALFGAGNGSAKMPLTHEMIFFFSVAVFFSIFSYWKKTRQFSESWFNGNFSTRITYPVAIFTSIILFLVSLSFATTGDFNPFLYFRF